MWNKPLNRRTFIYGAGVTLALPWLEAMLPFNRSWAAIPPRFALLYMGNGMMSGRYDGTYDYWNCKGSSTGITTYSQCLQSMSAFKDYLTIIQHTAQTVIEPQTHWKSTAAFSCGQGAVNAAGVLASGPDDLTKLYYSNGQSIDRMIAARQSTSLKSLMLAVGKTSGDFVNGDNPSFLTNLSWDSQTASLDSQTIRATSDAFNRLVSSGLKTSGPAPANTALTQKKSVLDAIIGDANAMMAKLGPSDKQVMDQYLTSVRQIETDIQNAAGNTPVVQGCTTPSSATQTVYAAKNNATVAGVTKTADLMSDILALAFQCGITNVASLMLSYDWGTANPHDAYGVTTTTTGLLHDDTHYLTNNTLDSVLMYQNWHAQRLAYYAQKLKATPDANGGNLLDNSLTLFGAGMGDPNDHLFSGMLRVLLGKGGGLNPGANGNLVDAKNATNSHPKLLQSILAQYGITDPIGDSGGQSLAGVFR
jgi:hypothetical protein